MQLVDDGVTDRGHGRSLLDPRFESIEPRRTERKESGRIAWFTQAM